MINLVHSILLHSKLPAVSVRGFGSLFLLLYLLVLHSHLLPELCHTVGAKQHTGAQSKQVYGSRNLGCHDDNKPGSRKSAFTLMFWRRKRRHISAAEL